MVETLSAQRIDVWLWHARFYKTRSLASKMVRGGKVRVNGNVCKKSSTIITIKDVLTFARSDDILIAKVIAFSNRRGPAPEAQTLYDDLTPPKEAKSKFVKGNVAVRERGSGRPTKAQRRAIDKLRDI